MHRSSQYELQLSVITHAAGLSVSAQEDWAADREKNDNVECVKSELMEQREAFGLPACSPKPEGIDTISYGTFYDSIFELADCMVGRGAGGAVPFACCRMV